MIEFNEYIKNKNRNKVIKGELFSVNSSTDISNYKFENCTFNLYSGAILNSNNSSFTGTSFVSKSEKQQHKPKLNILGSLVFFDVSINGEFEKIDLNWVKANILIDISKTKNFVILNSEICNFFIEGEAETIQIEDSYFTSKKQKEKTKDNHSIWNKKIIKNAVCNNTIFHNVRVHPFYLATKCKNKSTLDLTGAELIDDWSSLRKRYSGLSLFIVFLLSLSFFLPLITQSFFLLLSNKIDPGVVNFSKSPLWEVLLYGGKEGWERALYAILTSILTIYNLLRIYMTISIARLREEEKFLSDSNFQLVSIHPDKFITQRFIDKVLKILFWISFIYAMIKFKDTLFISVPNL